MYRVKSERQARPTAVVWKLLVAVAALAITLLRPGPAMAQGALPLQWLYSPLSGVTLAYSPDGSLIATGGPGGLEIRNARTGVPVQGLPTSAAAVVSIAFSPDGKSLASGGFAVDSQGNHYGVVELWNLATGKRPYTLNSIATLGVISVAFSPDGKTLADGGGTRATSEGILETWDVGTGKPGFSTTSATSLGMVSSVVFSPDGKTIASGGWSDAGSYWFADVKLWNASNGALISQYPENLTINSYQQGLSVALAFSPDGTKLAEGAFGGFLRTWNVSTGQGLTTFKTAASYDIYSVAFSPDGKTLADGGWNGSSGVVETWKLSGTQIHAPATATATIQSIAFSPDGKTLADGGGTSASNGAGIGLLETNSTSTGNQIAALTTASAGGSYVTFSPDGKTLATGSSVYVNGGSSGTLSLWNSTTGALLNTLSSAATGIDAVAFSPDDQTVAVGGASGVLELWNASTGTRLTTLKSAAVNGVQAVAFSADGKTIVDGGVGADAQGHAIGVLEVWSVSTGKLTATLNTAATNVASVSLSADGVTLADGGANSTSGIVELWNLSTGKLTATLKTAAAGVSSVAFSPSGSTLAVGGSAGSNGVLELWKVSTGKLLSTLALVSGTEIVSAVGFSPDGKVLVAGTDASVQTFSTVNYGLFTYYNQIVAGGITSVAVSPDGTLLAYGTANGSIVAASGPAVPALTSMSISPATVSPGISATITIKLAGPAPAGGLTIDLSSSVPSALPVPATKTIAAGGSVATIAITAGSVNAGTIVTVTASIAGASTAPQSGTVSVVPWVQSVTVSPGSVAGGVFATETIKLNNPAPAGGLKVAVWSSSSIATPVDSSHNPVSAVTVPAGATSATVAIETQVTTSGHAATLTASNRSVNQTCTLTVTPTTVSLALSPGKVAGGQSSYGIVTLSGVAPAGGAIVKLKSSATCASVPGSITVPAGSSSAVFTITTTAVTSLTSATIKATYGGVSSSATLTVQPVVVGTLTIIPGSVSGGNNAIGVITLASAPTADTTIALASSNAKVAAPPASVVIPAGTTSVTFNITTTPVTSSTSVTITATVNSHNITGTLTVSP